MTRRGWSSAIRCLKFNLVGGIGIEVQLLTITACSVVNFLVSDGFMFAEHPEETQSMW